MTNRHLVDYEDLIAALLTAQANPDIKPYEILAALPMVAAEPPRPRKYRRPAPDINLEPFAFFSLALGAAACLFTLLSVAAGIGGRVGRGDVATLAAVSAWCWLMALALVMVALVVLIWRWRAAR